ncbi:MAG: DUF1573 domain-containing protein [Bacteroidetes bacterium]|nr:MAG: DUF1573 domain-containing protein [Bacteroidota bacterium]
MGKLKGILVLALLISGTYGWAQSQRVNLTILDTDPILTASSPMPRISWSSKTRDIGYRPVGETYSTTLRFQNTGNDYLKIQGVSSSSSQCVASHQEEEIAPGDGGLITIQITPARPGAFQFFLTVTSNTREVAEVISIRGIAH